MPFTIITHIISLVMIFLIIAGGVRVGLVVNGKNNLRLKLSKPVPRIYWNGLFLLTKKPKRHKLT